MAFRYDAETGEASGLSLLESTQSMVRAGEWIAGMIRVLVSAIEVEALDGNVDTGFQHGVHDWHIPNFNSYLSPSGVCAGLALSEVYYFLEELGPPLYGRYDNHENGYVSTPGLWNDDEQALRLVSVVQEAIDWDNRALLFQVQDGKYIQNELQHFLDCIETGRTPVTNARDSIQGLRVIWRLYAAERKGVVADLRGLGLGG